MFSLIMVEIMKKEMNLMTIISHWKSVILEM